MSLWNNRFSQNSNEKISEISALAYKERSRGQIKNFIKPIMLKDQ